jgi:hypothetical protein
VREQIAFAGGEQWGQAFLCSILFSQAPSTEGERTPVSPHLPKAVWLGSEEETRLQEDAGEEF